eukprot:CAMPEP_0117036816 /NCGR_PEP_ID=MMETSP0472-20121206/26044_1 /TAXON_ID=693140 ORGANISM="Tiarina fusus, Strain LIS" /NCGR_SAMPLE_ID=MMETSP0472 /ASSEMBLY_ACC=CAM_ASM_000603 /LENGTH=142 /DNA_ID=CAMNT_0004746659 /DNA_START=83 /DNA_END=509 /DNA_ORIENTATION=-
MTTGSLSYQPSWSLFFTIATLSAGAGAGDLSHLTTLETNRETEQEQTHRAWAKWRRSPGRVMEGGERVVSSRTGPPKEYLEAPVQRASRGLGSQCASFWALPERRPAPWQPEECHVEQLSARSQSPESEELGQEWEDLALEW